MYTHKLPDLSRFSRPRFQVLDTSRYLNVSTTSLTLGNRQNSNFGIARFFLSSRKFSGFELAWTHFPDLSKVRRNSLIFPVSRPRFIQIPGSRYIEIPRFPTFLSQKLEFYTSRVFLVFKEVLWLWTCINDIRRLFRPSRISWLFYKARMIETLNRNIELQPYKRVRRHNL